MPIPIEQARRAVESAYVGFSPNTTSVKPVHVANGLFRAVLGTTAPTRVLHRFVFAQTQKGEVPRGHELEAVIGELRGADRMDGSVAPDELARLRVMLKKVVGADDAVYTEGMESYSAGQRQFVSRDRIGQDGGEFVAEWLAAEQSPLRDYIRAALGASGDPITLLCKPLLESADHTWSPTMDGQAMLLNEPLPEEPARLTAGLAAAAQTLSRHLSQQENKLLGLRFAVLFSCFVIVRRLALLEACFVPRARQAVLPFLLHFSSGATEPAGRASLLTYTFACQSLSRFYAWAFGQYLGDRFTLAELRDDEPPTYTRGRASTTAIPEVWRLALAAAQQSSEPLLVLGQSLYDMMAMEAESNPIAYMRQLGHRCGLMWPPRNTQPSKWFFVQQDMLEVLVRGAVEPAEALDMPQLQDRFWSRYGILIGGRPEDEELLIDTGVYQADRRALEENSDRFGDVLGHAGFARLLADGVLQVALESGRAS